MLQVLTVREILSYGVGDHIGARVELENLALKALTYSLAPDHKLEDLAAEVKRFLPVHFLAFCYHYILLYLVVITFLLLWVMSA